MAKGPNVRLSPSTQVGLLVASAPKLGLRQKTQHALGRDGSELAMATSVTWGGGGLGRKPRPWGAFIVLTSKGDVIKVPLNSLIHALIHLRNIPQTTSPSPGAVLSYPLFTVVPCGRAFSAIRTLSFLLTWVSGMHRPMGHRRSGARKNQLLERRLAESAGAGPGVLPLGVPSTHRGTQPFVTTPALATASHPSPPPHPFPP